MYLCNMKNIIFVDLDTDREDEPVRLGKIDYKEPEDKDKFTADVILDLKTLVEGVLVIGSQLDVRGIQSFDDTLDDVVSQLKDGWENHNKSDKDKNVEE